MYSRRFPRCRLIGIVTARLFHRGQARTEARLFECQRFGGMAAVRDRARGVALARLPHLARHFCRRFPGQSYDCGQSSRPRSASRRETRSKRFAEPGSLIRFAGGTRAFDRAQDVFKFALAVATQHVDQSDALASPVWPSAGFARLGESTAPSG